MVLNRYFLKYRGFFLRVLSGACVFKNPSWHSLFSSDHHQLLGSLNFFKWRGLLILICCLCVQMTNKSRAQRQKCTIACCFVESVAFSRLLLGVAGGLVGAFCTLCLIDFESHHQIGGG